MRTQPARIHRARIGLALFTSLAVAACGMASTAPAWAVSRPDSFRSVSVTSTAARTFTVHWSQSGHHTTGYRIETGLNPFSKTNPSMPSIGRHSHVFTVSAKARSFTFSASALAAAGAPFGSGNEVYFRLSALNSTSAGTQTRAYPYLQAGIPKAPSYRGRSVRIGTFNVLTASASAHPWLSRVHNVAQEIRTDNPGLAALQELNVGRADGKSGWNHGTPRQTDSLLTELAKLGTKKYRLVRDTPYTSPNDHVNTQGERILYDSSRFSLSSSCPNTTGSHAYSSSCSIRLPLRKQDSKTLTRFAGYAKFTDRSTHAQFYLVSVHLDDRHTGSAAQQRSFDQLRKAQVAAVTSRLNKINTKHLRVIVAGDFNGWQNDRYGDSSHDALVGAGYTDSYAASRVIRGQYGTYNAFATTVHPGVNNFATRLDKIMTKGFHGTSQWNNVVKVTDAHRDSDHNLVLSDIVY